MKQKFNITINRTDLKKNKSKQFFESRSNMQHLNFLGIICFSLFFIFSISTTIQAQENNSIAVPTQKTIKEKETISKTINEEEIIKGIVYDESKLPLESVNVILEGIAIGTVTNTKGEFTFPKKLKEGDILIFSHIGLETQRIKTNKNHAFLNIIMKVDPNELLGEVQVNNRTYKSKRSFWQKVKTIF